MFLVFFIWILILCCSAANGILFERFGMPENFIFMLIPTACVTVLLWGHQRLTKDWEMPLSAWDEYSSYRFPIFWVSMVVGAIAFAFIMFLSYYMPIPYVGAILVSLGTLVISSFVANMRERCYSVFWTL